MAARKPKKSAEQLELDGTATAWKKKAVERAAESDLRELRSTHSLSQAVSALAVAYRLCAREVDRAELEEDRWGKMKATSELRALRERLGPVEAPAHEDDLLDSLRASLGDAPQPGPPDQR